MNRPDSSRNRLEANVVSTHLVFIFDPSFLSTLVFTSSWYYSQKIKLIFFFFFSSYVFCQFLCKNVSSNLKLMLNWIFWKYIKIKNSAGKNELVSLITVVKRNPCNPFPFPSSEKMIFSEMKMSDQIKYFKMNFYIVHVRVLDFSVPNVK